MATDISGLFGLTPESYQASQEQQARQQAAQFAEMNPFQRANYGLFLGGRQLGGAVGQALGAQDPQLQKISTINALSKQFDITTPQGMNSMAAALKDKYPDVALQVANQAQAMAAASAETQKKQLSLQQEENLRAELGKLGPDASTEDLLKVVSRYGPPDKILSVLQASTDRAAQRQQQMDAAKERNAILLQNAQERNATSKEIAQIQADSRKELAAIANAFKTGQQAAKPLSTQDIKMTNELSAAVKDADYGITQADKFTKLIDENKMQFGLVENLSSKARALAGASTPSDVAKSDLEKWMTSSINAVLNQAKGVQAKDDAVRAQKQVMEAIDKNDPKLIKNAIERVKQLLQNTRDDAISGLELIGQERNRDLTGRIKAAGTKENPIVLK